MTSESRRIRWRDLAPGMQVRGSFDLVLDAMNAAPYDLDAGVVRPGKVPEADAVDRLGIPGVGAEVIFGKSIVAVTVRIERSVDGVGRIESVETFPKVGKSICVRIRQRFGANFNRARIRRRAGKAGQAAGVKHDITGTTSVK